MFAQLLSLIPLIDSITDVDVLFLTSRSRKRKKFVVRLGLAHVHFFFLLTSVLVI
jgi:hypothetical protein